MNNKLLFLVTYTCMIGLSTTATTDAQANSCDADMLRVAKSIYSSNKEMSVAEHLFQHTCNLDKQNLTGHINIVGLLTGSTGYQSLSQACATLNKNFFEAQKEQLLISALPDPMLLACLGGTSFTANLSGDNKNILLVISYYYSQDIKAVTVKEISWRPSKAISCNKKEIEGIELIPGSRRFTCARNLNEDVFITLTTSAGDKSLYLEHKPVIQQLDYVWDYSILPHADSHFWCFNQFSRIGGNLSCTDHGVCNNPKGMRQTCAAEWGSKYTVIDGKRIEHPLEKSPYNEVKPIHHLDE